MAPDEDRDEAALGDVRFNPSADEFSWVSACVRFRPMAAEDDSTDAALGDVRLSPRADESTTDAA